MKKSKVKPGDTFIGQEGTAGYWVVMHEFDDSILALPIFGGPLRPHYFSCLKNKSTFDLWYRWKSIRDITKPLSPGVKRKWFKSYKRLSKFIEKPSPRLRRFINEQTKQRSSIHGDGKRRIKKINVRKKKRRLRSRK